MVAFKSLRESEERESVKRGWRREKEWDGRELVAKD
jgi:hypothetical protein